MDRERLFSLSRYQDLFRITEETLRLCVKTMPPVADGNFTEGYLQGVIFLWWQMANEYGISASVIDKDENYLRTLAGLPGKSEQK